MTVKQEAVANDGKFTVYKLMKLTYEQFQKAAQAANAVPTEEKVSEAFKELEARLESRKTAAQ
ncbi:hypothetical protein AB6C82_24025 [Vibrio splendidus]